MAKSCKIEKHIASKKAYGPQNTEQFGLYHAVVPLSFLRSISLASLFSSLNRGTLATVSESTVQHYMKIFSQQQSTR